MKRYTPGFIFTVCPLSPATRARSLRLEMTATSSLAELDALSASEASRYDKTCFAFM